MPGKIKSPKQFRLFEGIKHGMKPRKGIGPSPEVASKMLGEETHETRSRLARGKRIK